MDAAYIVILVIAFLGASIYFGCQPGVLDEMQEIRDYNPAMSTCNEWKNTFSPVELYDYVIVFRNGTIINEERQTQFPIFTPSLIVNMVSYETQVTIVNQYCVNKTPTIFNPEIHTCNTINGTQCVAWNFKEQKVNLISDQQNCTQGTEIQKLTKNNTIIDFGNKKLCIQNG